MFQDQSNPERSDENKLATAWPLAATKTPANSPETAVPVRRFPCVMDACPPSSNDTPSASQSNRPKPKPATRRPRLSTWQLPKLIESVHHYRKSRGLKPRERPHFKGILAFVYRNRFVTAEQVRRRFSSMVRSDRTARRHLAEMEALGYLNLVPTRAVGPLFPKVYFVGWRGVRRLHEALTAAGKPGDVSRIDRGVPRGYSSEHVIHELFVAEFMLSVWETISSRDDLELLFVQRRAVEREKGLLVTVNGMRSRVKPDAIFVFRHTPAGMVACFLEMDSGSMSRQQMDRKLRRYEVWAESTVGREFLSNLYRKCGSKQTRPVFRLLIVCRDREGRNDERRQRSLCETAERRAVLRPMVWITTVDKLSSYPSSESLNQGMWLRLHAASVSGTSASALTPLFPARADG
jgi:hypothetical protein